MFLDLLHYLQSCHGLDYYLGEFASTVGSLIEEVYTKALQMKLWNIVRQAAGLLRKTVSSLTLDLTDLIIRQKTITIGPTENEYFIRTALGPSELAKVIYSRW